MTVLVIVAILIAFAYIFGKRSAQLLVLGSGALAVSLLVIGLVGALIYYLWTDESAQKVLGYAVFFIVVAGIRLVVDDDRKLSVEKDEKTAKPNEKFSVNKLIDRHPYISLSILVIALFLGYQILSTSNPTIDQPKNVSFGAQIMTETGTYRYILVDATNVRSCGSLDCAIIGEYPAGTSIELLVSYSDLPEWNEIFWVEGGVNKFGYIHKSTVKTGTYLDKLKPLSNQDNE